MNAKAASWSDERQYLLKWLLPSLMGISLLVLLVLWIPSISPDPLRNAYTILILVAGGLLAIAYQGNNRNQYRWSSRLVVLSAAVGTWGSVLIDRHNLAQNIVPMFYAVYPLALAAVLLEGPDVAAVAVLQVVSIIAFAVWIGMPTGASFASLVFFHLFAAAIGSVANAISQRNRRQLDQKTSALTESEQRFRQVFEAGGIGMAVIDLEYRFVDVNAVLCATVGYTAEELRTRGSADITHPNDQEASREWWQNLKGSETAPEQLKKRYVHKQGQVVWINLTGSIIRSVDGRPQYFLAMMEDITAREAAQASLQTVNSQLVTGLEALEHRTSELALLQELSSKLQGCLTLPEAYEQFAHSAAQLFTGGVGDLFASPQAASELLPVAAWNHELRSSALAPTACPVLSDQSAQRPTVPDCRSVCPYGEARGHLCIPWVDRGGGSIILQLQWPVDAPMAASDEEWAVCQRLAHTAADSLGLAVGNLRLTETLREQSVRDPLTGLYNRRYLVATAERELRRADRLRQSVGLILLDLDHFKQFNDTFGHSAGDAVLRSVSTYLRESMRFSDITCRYGGEEFCLLLPDSSLADTLRRAEEVRVGIRQLTLTHAGQPLGSITASVGVAAHPLHSAAWPDLLEMADRGMYRAKSNGRDCVAVDDRQGTAELAPAR